MAYGPLVLGYQLDKKSQRKSGENKRQPFWFKDRWIVEGYIDGEITPERLRRAELGYRYSIYPVSVRASHGLLRWWKYRKAPRPELPAGCTEKLDYSHLWTIVARKERRAIQAALEKAAPREIVVLNRNVR